MEIYCKLACLLLLLHRCILNSHWLCKGREQLISWWQKKEESDWKAEIGFSNSWRSLLNRALIATWIIGNLGTWMPVRERICWYLARKAPRAILRSLDQQGSWEKGSTQTKKEATIKNLNFASSGEVRHSDILCALFWSDSDHRWINLGYQQTNVYIVYDLIVNCLL